MFFNSQKTWKDGSFQSLILYYKLNRKEATANPNGFGPDGQKFMNSDKFASMKKMITQEMNTWKFSTLLP